MDLHARGPRLMDARSQFLHWTQLLLRVWLVWNFAFYGIVKLLDRAGSVTTAQSFGFPGWSWFVIGTIETLAALALLIRPVAGIAASTLTTIMLGAVATHVWNGVPVRVPLRLLAFLVALLIVWAVQRRQRP